MVFPRLVASRERRSRTRRPAESPSSGPGRCTNLLLQLLPPPLLARLNTYLEPVHLERKEVLFRAQEPVRVVYFPDCAVISFVSRLETGETLEVGMVGRDGFAATGVFPGITTMTCDGIVQIPGLARRMSADVLRREMQANEELHSILCRFAQTLLVRSMQMSVCNTFHSVEQRCIRWLLTVSDLIIENQVPLTHELLATMLGVHRPTVTVVIRSLQRAGLVEEVRGQITIVNRARIAEACCECYRLMRDEQYRLLGY